MIALNYMSTNQVNKQNRIQYKRKKLFMYSAYFKKTDSQTLTNSTFNYTIYLLPMPMFPCVKELDACSAYDTNVFDLEHFHRLD